MSNELKLLPNGIKKIEYKTSDSEEFLKQEQMICYDNDDDIWVLNTAKYFYINLTEFNSNIDFSKNQLNTTNINKVLETLFKSKTLNLKYQLVLYLDEIFTNEYTRRCGFATDMLKHLKEVARKNDCKAIVLNAMPISSSKTDINKKKQKIQKFYSKRGFKAINQKSDLMFIKV